MDDRIRGIIAEVIGGDTAEIGYEFTATTEKIWIMNPDRLADAINQRLEQNGYSIVKSKLPHATTEETHG